MKTELLCDNEMSDKVRSSSKKGHRFIYVSFYPFRFGSRWSS